jgi:hypothetical protein
MVAGAVIARGGILVIEPADHLNLALQWQERLHRFAEREIATLARRPPIILMRAVWEIDERHAQRCARGRSGETTSERGVGGARHRAQQGVEDGQRDARTHAAQKLPAAEAEVTLGSSERVMDERSG